MTRSELEHLIRAAGEISKDSEIVVIGSQSILGQHPDAPLTLLTSTEADVYPRNHPERADEIDGIIGEGSRFHETHGYYAQGVSKDTATLPRGWQERLVSIRNKNTRDVAGLCLEVHDLAISKYVAGRDKDREFTAELAKHRLTLQPLLRERLAETAISDALREVVNARIRGDFKARD
jgi:hypothetical protein